MFVISEVPIDVVRLQHGLEAEAAGAVVCFEGRVRNHNDGRAVNGLSYQAYIELAEAEGRRIVEETRSRFAVERVSCVHRVGDRYLVRQAS